MVPIIQVRSIGWLAAGNRLTLTTSDPQEGGEIVREASRPSRRKGKAAITEINISKKVDASSPKLVTDSDPGDAPASGTATITVARGACAKGQHLPEVKLVARTREYRLRDVEVTGCTAADGETDSCTLTYAGVGG